MSGPLHQFSKDLYKLLHLPRTATQNEIKVSYRKIALALHPDRHDGCDIKTSAFKEVSDAYRILADYRQRIEYDRWLDGVSLGEDGMIRKRTSRAAERNPFYRKVYSPAAPPGMKTFDRQRHYDMHYGQGMMNEEIERARRRAEATSPRKNGFSYTSPLGAGFSFNKDRPMDQQMNPFSKKGMKQHDHLDKKNGGFRIEYEEAYFDMDGQDLSEAKRNMRGKEFVVERMKDRRSRRVRERDEMRERGEPDPFQRRNGRRVENDAEGAGCVVM